MNMKRLVSKQTIANFSRFNGKFVISSHARDLSTIAAISCTLPRNPKCRNQDSFFFKYIHSTPQAMYGNSTAEVKILSGDDDSDENNGTMNEFLSRFVSIMRGRLSEAYPDCDNKMIDGMLLLIVEKVSTEMEKGGLEHMLSAEDSVSSEDFNEDLWKTVWEVSNLVLADMEKERKKEKMKQFLQSEEVKQMCRFAGEVGIRGEMLREMRFKWAREKMEETDFYESLDRLRKESKAQDFEAEVKEGEGVAMAEEDRGVSVGEEKAETVSLPKRHGKIKYKIYGLDLSDSKWAGVADKIHQQGEILWPQEPKPITGECKMVTQKILSLKDNDDFFLLLAEWVELLQPNRIDWISLLDRLKEHSPTLYFKVAEHVLREKSFQTNIRDYANLMEALANENHIEDAERILKKMYEDGMALDILTASVLVQMYQKAGNLDRAKEAFEFIENLFPKKNIIKDHNLMPDKKVYKSMIMAYLDANQPHSGEILMKKMDKKDIPLEIYMELLQCFSKYPDPDGVRRIMFDMKLAGFQQSLEAWTLLFDALAQVGNGDLAKIKFDEMIQEGIKPDDRCMASMISAFENRNMLDKALNFLLKLEKDGFEPGPATHAVLFEWLAKLQLVDEAEHLLGKISVPGEAAPLKIQVSLCDMYAKAKVERKALQALGVLEARKEELRADEFERIIKSLIDGGFLRDAQRVYKMMESCGFIVPESLGVSLKAAESFSRNRPPTKYADSKASKHIQFMKK